MDLTLTEDQRLIQSTARELLDSRAAAAAAGARAVADDPAGCPAGYSARLWKEIVELGWTGLAFPEEYGGVGEGFLELCLVLEELGRSRVPTPLAATVACCGMPILRYGTDTQRAEWLGAIARGQVMSYVAGGDTDDGGSVLADRSGDEFVLHGEASFVPYADAADNPRTGHGDVVETHPVHRIRDHVQRFAGDARRGGVHHRGDRSVGVPCGHE